MSLVTKTTHGYECVSCGAIVPADSPFNTDAPEGYYFSVRRVTESHNHTMTPELFTCDKECLINFVTYGISHNAIPVEPIGRKKKGR
jgi:hypothetical protein